MGHRRLASLLALALLAFSCGGGSSSPTGASDAGSPGLDASAADSSSSNDAAPPTDSAPPLDSTLPTSDAGPDGQATDAAPDASEDASPDAQLDAGPALLVAGSKLRVIGGTTDPLVVYWGPTTTGATTNSIFVVPPGGGTPTAIAGPFTGRFYVQIYGPDVFIWNLVGTTSVGALSVWTQAHGLVPLAASSVEDNAWANADGSTILYAANATTTQKDVWIAKNDGMGAIALVTGMYRTSCNVAAVLRGSDAIVQHCEQPITDGGSNGSIPPTLTFFPDGGTSGKVDIVTLPADAITNIWSVDQQEDELYAPTVTGSQPGSVFALPSLTSTTVEPNGAAEGFFVADGGVVVYRTTSGEVRRSSTTGPSPTTLVPSGASGFLWGSNDESLVTYYTQLASSSSGVSVTDLNVASLATPDAAFQVVSTASVIPVGYSGAFTADSSHLLYVTGSTTNTTSGTLFALPLADGGAARQLSTNVSADTVTSGASLVYGDNYSSSAGTFDIHVIDLASGAPATLIAAGATDYRYDRSLVTLFYATNAAPPGIYSLALP
jgi:hypothetical protein